MANTVLFAGTFEARYPSQQGGVALSLLWKVVFQRILLGFNATVSVLQCFWQHTHSWIRRTHHPVTCRVPWPAESAHPASCEFSSSKVGTLHVEAHLAVLQHRQ